MQNKNFSIELGRANLTDDALDRFKQIDTESYYSNEWERNQHKPWNQIHNA